MSYQSWQAASEFVDGSRAVEMIRHIANAPDQAPGERPRAVPLQNSARAEIEFKNISASISVLADGQTTAAAENGWRFRSANDVCETLLSFPDAVQRSPGARATTREDPVVVRLSEALAAAERDPSEFAALYADAIRLVTVARILSRRSQDDEVREPPPAAGTALPKWRFKLVVDYVTAHLGDKVTLADMAAAARLSRMHFAALFLRATGLRPHQYLLQRRVAAAQQMLQSTDHPIVQIAIDVGFQTQAHFTTVFKKMTGHTPAKWREMQRSQS
ncbi:helix-turn-helix domain-containing protein [Rhodopseudomonas sp. NSM]|uniref:helix-turn-helix domain-containing protein n=1 Tax=Rhodopseudomonas sp. NSM TaxID=3457630 RepID=UPI004036A9A6